MIRGLSRRERLIFIVCIVMAALFAGKRILWDSLQAAYSQSQSEVAAMEGVVSRYQLAITQYSAVQKTYKDISPRYRQQSSDEQETSALLSLISAQAALCGLSVSDLKPNRINHRDFYKEFSVSLSLDGEWIALMKFLHAIQQPARGLKILSLQVEKDSRPRGHLRCQLSVSRIFLANVLE